MPEMYRVAVKSPDSFDTEKPVIFTPIAHNVGQALRIVQAELQRAEGLLGLMHGTTQMHAEVYRTVGGYDTPELEAYMRTVAK